MSADWKQQFAEDAEQAILHDITQQTIDELLTNLGVTRESLVHYGILKVCNVAAQIARAHALGIDPETLIMTPDEAADVMARWGGGFGTSSTAVVMMWNTETDQ